MQWAVENWPCSATFKHQLQANAMPTECCKCADHGDNVSVDIGTTVCDKRTASGSKRTASRSKRTASGSKRTVSWTKRTARWTKRTPRWNKRIRRIRVCNATLPQ
jgi:hypothetical protein